MINNIRNAYVVTSRAAGLDVHIEFPQSHCSFVQIYALIRDFPITTLPNRNMVKKLCSPLDACQVVKGQVVKVGHKLAGR